MQQTLPATTSKIYHTSALPLRAECGSSAHIKSILGHHEHVWQLNTAGRHCAKQAGWHVVDFEMMAMQFHEAPLYLQDLHHPAPWFLKQAFQIYLNIHAALQYGHKDNKHKLYCGIMCLQRVDADAM